MNPTEKWTQRQIAEVYLKSADGLEPDPKKAVRHAVTALKLSGGKETMLRGTCQKAADALQHWMPEARQDDAEAHYLLAIVLGHLQRDEEARQFWEQAETLFSQQEKEPADSFSELREEARLLVAAGEDSGPEE